MKMRSKKNYSTRKKTKNKNSDILAKVSAKRCCKDEDETDRISELPNDVLVSILSLLTFREATATKILSSRWGRLDPVANIVSHVFPFPLERRKSYLGGCIQSARDQDTISEYISRVNHALDSYEGGLSIDRFKIDIPCVAVAGPIGTDLRLAGAHCEKWLEFALSKETEIIDIRTIYDSNYSLRLATKVSQVTVFPLSFSCRSGTLVARRREYNSSNYILHISVHSILGKHGNSLPGLKYLKQLSLSEVYFDDYKDLLPKLVVLERLSIESPQTLTMYIGVGDCVNVKYLHIFNFEKVKDIVIGDMPNLVSLRCHGLESYRLHIDHSPKLVDISIVNAQSGIDGAIIPDQFDINGHLLGIRLYFRLLDHEWGNQRSYMPPTLTQVKHMVLDIQIHEKSSNYQLFPLIQTCPFMEKLEIKFLWSSRVTYKYRRLDKDLTKRKVAISKLQTLKLSGYRGTVSELEFILYVVNNATKLKDLIIVEPPHKYSRRSRFITGAFKHLRSVIPTYVNFILS